MKIIASQVFFLLGFSALLIGCNSATVIPKAGHYEGTLIERQGEVLISEAVSAEVSELKNGSALIQVKIETQTGLEPSGSRLSPMTVAISNVALDGLTLGLQGYLPDQVSLQAKGSCFQSLQAPMIRFCPESAALTLEMNDAQSSPLLSLSLDSFGSTPNPALEAPRSFTLDELMQRAFSMEFNTRIEFQHTMQARHQAQQAYLNLLPHLSANSILSVASTGGFLGLVGAIGDLAPFLLPSRWFQAEESEDLSAAERDSLTLMKGDAGVQAEGLAYAAARDQKIALLFQQGLDQVDGVLEKVRLSESAGKLPAGTTDQIASIRFDMESDAAALDLSIREQRTYMAQALGYINPDAVISVEVPEPETPIEQATDLDERNFQSMVLSRSYELRQMDSLLHAAQAEKNAVFFSWMDPAGDPSLGLGAGLFGAVGVEDSKINELSESRAQLQAILLQQLTTTIDEYNDSMEDHKRAERNLQLQQQRLNRELQALNSTGQPNVLALVSALPDHLRAQIDVKTTEANYRLSTAKLNRLLLNGYYAKID